MQSSSAKAENHNDEEQDSEGLENEDRAHVLGGVDWAIANIIQSLSKEAVFDIGVDRQIFHKSIIFVSFAEVE